MAAEPEPAAARAPTAADADAADTGDGNELAFLRGDYRALRAEQARGTKLEARQRAALAVDPVHVAMLIACTVLLLGIALHYFGVGR